MEYEFFPDYCEMIGDYYCMKCDEQVWFRLSYFSGDYVCEKCKYNPYLKDYDHTLKKWNSYQSLVMNYCYK